MADDGRRHGPGWRRTRWTATSSLVLIVAAAVLAPSGRAQETAPETGEIRNGTAKAIAAVNRIVPGVGDLSLGITNGVAVTKITNQLAQATSQTADLGLIGSSLTSESCDEASPITPDDLPQPTFVDNRDGDTTASRNEIGPDGSPVGSGSMDVQAAEDPPAARATTTGIALNVPGLLRAGNGEATALTRVLPGEGREAVAVVQSSLSIGGALQLDGMRWEARHRTGVDPAASGTFEIGKAELGGVPFPTDDLGALEDALNELLAPSGVTVTFPRTQRVQDPSDFVRVTPLRIEVRDSPAGKTALGPVLELSRAQRSQLFDAVVQAYCKSAGVLLVGDVGVSIASGTGFLTVDIGGVEASSADLELGNPFGDFTPIGPATAPLPAGAAPVVPGSPSSPDVATAPAANTATPQPASSTGPIEELCESVHPNHGGCSQGAGAVAGVIGLFATAGVAGADLFRQRRRAGSVAV